MTEIGVKVKIIAQPKALFRQRYESESKKDKDSLLVIRRLIRAENESGKKYPTIEVIYPCVFERNFVDLFSEIDTLAIEV